MSARTGGGGADSRRGGSHGAGVLRLEQAPAKENSKVHALLQHPVAAEGIVRKLAKAIGEQAYSSELIKSVNTSMANNRPGTSAVILVVGDSGVGKSSSLQHIFAGLTRKYADVAALLFPAGKGGAVTSDCTSVRVGFEVPGICSDGGLVVIDTPGYRDSRGQRLDSVNLYDKANLEMIQRMRRDFLQLRYPSVVLLTWRAGDERLNGDFASFCKVLQGMGFVDTVKNNLIVLMTHATAMVDPDSEGEERAAEYRAATQAESEHVQQIVKRELSVDVEVVYVENRVITKKSYDPAKWTKLPDGTDQPWNVIKQCPSLCKELTLSLWIS
eukprot:m.22971 g.22971  ORF g.22971 m.22971 type:complete len:328 (+) comp9316_c0_seq1:173-1156(+)